MINKSFWFALPGLVKARRRRVVCMCDVVQEGCRFTWSKITRNDYQKL